MRLDLVEAVLESPGGDDAVRLKTGAQLEVSRGRIEELERRLGLLRE